MTQVIGIWLLFIMISWIILIKASFLRHTLFKRNQHLLIKIYSYSQNTWACCIACCHWIIGSLAIWTTMCRFWIVSWSISFPYSIITGRCTWSPCSLYTPVFIYYEQKRCLVHKFMHYVWYKTFLAHKDLSAIQHFKSKINEIISEMPLN